MGCEIKTGGAMIAQQDDSPLPKCYAYGRHSTDKQGLTRKAQFKSAKGYFNAYLKGKAEWMGLYYDPATKGNFPFSERPKGREIFAALMPGDHLILPKIDRGFRSVHDGSITIHALHQRGVIVHIVDLRVDTTTPMGQFFLNTLLSMAQLERDFASQRTKEVLTALREADKPYCRSAPIGWKIVGKKLGKRYHVDYDERALVDAMQVLRDRGWSQDDISMWCRRQRIYKCKRTFSDRCTVRWALMARACDYPKIVGYKRLRRLVKEGKLVAQPF